jgi:hypothetical protein
LIIILFASAWAFGCGSDLPHSNPLDTTTTTTIAPITSFLGVSLGASSQEVIASLGQPYSKGITTGGNFYLFEYHPYSTQYRYVYFNLTSYEVVAVRSFVSHYSDNIRGIYVDSSENTVKAAIGTTTYESTGASTYIWHYPSLNIVITFDFSTKYVQSIGILNWNEIYFTPY